MMHINNCSPATFTRLEKSILSFYLGTTTAGGELRGGVNPLKDRLKLDNCVTRAMQDVMKLVRVASNRHLRNWEAPDALVQEIIPWRVKQPWAKLRRGHTEDTGKRPAVFYTYI